MGKLFSCIMVSSRTTKCIVTSPNETAGATVACTIGSRVQETGIKPILVVGRQLSNFYSTLTFFTIFTFHCMLEISSGQFSSVKTSLTKDVSISSTRYNNYNHVCVHTQHAHEMCTLIKPLTFIRQKVCLNPSIQCPSVLDFVNCLKIGVDTYKNPLQIYRCVFINTHYCHNPVVKTQDPMSSLWCPRTVWFWW